MSLENWRIWYNRQIVQTDFNKKSILMILWKFEFFQFFVQKIAYNDIEHKYKREVLHEEFLRKLFFWKVSLLLNMLIYYNFFISHILFDLSPFEASTTVVLDFLHQTRFFRYLYQVKKPNTTVVEASHGDKSKSIWDMKKL